MGNQLGKNEAINEQINNDNMMSTNAGRSCGGRIRGLTGLEADFVI